MSTRFPGIEEQANQFRQAAGLTQQTAAPEIDATPGMQAEFDEQRERGIRAIDRTLDLAIPRNPDKAAEAQSLATRFGLDIKTVEAKQDELARIARAQDLRESISDLPTFSRRMSDLSFAEIAHDDTEALGGIERAAQFLKNTGNAMLGGLVNASGGVVGVARGAAELADMVLPGSPLTPVAAGLKAYQQGINRRAEMTMPQGQGNIESGFYSGMASLSRNLALLPALFLPGGQRAAMTGMIAPVAGGEYGEGREAGMNPVQAATFGASQAAIEYATERLPLTKLLDDLKVGRGFMPILAKQMALEIPGEQLATFFQDMNTWAAIESNQGKSFGDFMRERPDAAIQTLVATVVGTGGQVTVVGAIDKVAGHIAFREERALAAEQHALVIAEMSEMAKASKVLQRSPQAMADFVQQVAEEGGAENVYIPAQVLNQMATQAGISMDQLPPAVQAQMEEALAVGGDIVIPVGDYVAGIAKTEYGQALVDHIKLDVNGMSRAEAADFMATKDQQFQEEAAAAIERAQMSEAMAESSRAVRAYFDQQLATTGRFRPEVQTTYSNLLSNFYTVTAAKVGMTPEQLLERYPLRIQSEQAIGARVFEQDGRVEVEGQGQPTGQPEYQAEYVAGEEAFDIKLHQEVMGMGADRQLVVMVEAFTKDGNRRALVNFAAEGNTLKAENALTATAYQRRGLAKAMYQAARAAGYDIAPGRVQTEQGAKMVEGLRAQGIINKDGKAPSQIETPEFKAWFASSKVTDSNGKPRVVYHGTAGDFDTFDTETQGKNYRSTGGQKGFFFTSSPATASVYAEKPALADLDPSVPESADFGDGTANIMPVYLSLQNPIVVNTKDGADKHFDYNRDKLYERAEKAGADGIIVNGSNRTLYVAFEPGQIKSAIGNRGSFSANSSNILFQGAVERLSSLATRGVRRVATRVELSAEEVEAIRTSAPKIGMTVEELTEIVTDHKKAHPASDRWAPLVYKGSKPAKKSDDDEPGKAVKAEHNYQAIPYGFASDETGKKIDVGTPEYKKRVNAIARKMTEEVRKVFKRAEGGDRAAQNILAQAGWYKSMRSRLRQEFGGLGDLYADLLGATSPNTPVRTNWDNAIEAMRRASKGEYDAKIEQWEQWVIGVERAEAKLSAFFHEKYQGGEGGFSKAAIKEMPEYLAIYEEVKAARNVPDDLLPLKWNDKKFGFNGKNVIRAMVDLWRVVKNADADIGRGGTAPKALNFSGNLIGFRSRATIDVWAARMLNRLAGEKRIPSMAETGVTGEMREDGTTTLQFGMGQDIFARAAEMIRNDAMLNTDPVLAKVNDDDLQAIVWFIEKEVWTNNSWASAEGEGGSFELEANLAGYADRQRIAQLRTIAGGSPKKKVLALSKQSTAGKTKQQIKAIEKARAEVEKQAREKEAARAELATLERTVDRFVAGISIQQNEEYQGVNFVPTSADQAALGERLSTAIYEADQDAVVLGSKAYATEGRYGGSIEQSIDMEVVAREGFDPRPLWLRMLREARDNNQDSTFLARVLRPDEQLDYTRHRPGVEIYFQTSLSGQQLEDALAQLGKSGISNYTVVVDGRRSLEAIAGEKPPAVGVRFHYVPEFEDEGERKRIQSMSDEDLAAHVRSKGKEMKALTQKVANEIQGISFAGVFWHETNVAFRAEYQERIDGLTTGRIEGGSEGRAGQGDWAGRSVREGLAGADRNARTKTGGAGTEPDVSAGRVFNQDGLDAGGDRDRGEGRSPSRGLAPLEGAPSVPGFHGPDPRLVEVAERYAASRGIPYVRQGEYVEVDPDRAKRIAQAYAEMAHAPHDPVVREAYQNLIRQTLDQYNALVEAGYSFWFIDLSREDNQSYANSPWNAMRDIRANKRMGVFPTADGFGTNEEFNPDNNPLLADTGLMWPVGEAGSQVMAPVTANDVFRAVHDAFGHGLEGSGFRARGEENAWQAHARLFTGSALGALTSETRGQNSWLNYGPNGETNRTAKVEDTVFADQKTGLMPEWTWQEGIAQDAEVEPGTSVYDQSKQESEVAVVRRMYANTDRWMKAPNGKRTNLSENNWLMVRTPSFKNWFGDWEADPQNASKVVDENGEPQVYFHGSRKAGFTSFDTSGEGKTSGTGAFFADSIQMARGYAKGRTDDAPVYTAQELFDDPSLMPGLEIVEGIQVEVVVSSKGDKGWEWYVNEEQALADLELEEGEQLVTRPGYQVSMNGYVQEEGDREKVMEYLSTVEVEDKQPGIYSVFLNVRDAFVYDWGGENWDTGPGSKTWSVMDEDGELVDTVSYKEEAESIASEGDGYTVVENDPVPGLVTTDTVSAEARDMGADGVIIKDVFDTGPDGYAEDGTVVVVFDPANIKAINNRGTFDPQDTNILNQQEERQPRGQIALGDDITQTPSIITLFQGADLSTMLHETGHFFLEVQLDLASKISGDAAFNEGASDGERQLLADTQALMQWFGLESIDQWYTLDAAQRTAYHEQFARGFEAYLFEGSAPNVEVQSMFQRFRSWLLNIYKEIKALNVQLDDSVRGVMDRMLATEEQIEIAQMARSMVPLFTAPEQAGMTTQEFQAYQALGEQATATAHDELQSKAARDMAYSRNARGREIKRLQKQMAEQRREVRQEVRREVMQRPIYQAWGYLAGTDPNGVKGANKLAVNPANPNITPEQWAELTRLRMTAPNGMDVDMAADMIPGLAGQFTGDQLVREILAAEPPNELIERMTDQAMLEQFGELTTPEGIERAADQAVYNDVRARFVAAEYNAIARATGKPKMLAEAAKAMASNMISRLTLSNIKPHVYAAAEARAGRAAAKAMKAGDTEAAAVEKRNQVINAHASVAAKQAIAEAQEAMKLFRAVMRGSDKKTVARGLDPDVVNAAREILGMYGIGERSASRAADYVQVLARNNPEMYAVLQPSIEAASMMAKPVDQLTIEQLRGLRDEIQAMMHLARRSRVMEVGGRMLDKEEVLDELNAKVREIGIPLEIPGESSAITPMQSAVQRLQYARAILRRVEQWAEAKDGKFGGPFLNYIFQPVKAAADRYRADRNLYRRRYKELVEALAPTMKANKVIEAPELGYTFGKGHNGVGLAELLHAILHTGNESNKRKLLLGRGWATEVDGQLDTRKWDAFINRMHEQGVLQKVHYDFAQGVWDLLEEMKPAAQKAHRDVFGRYFEEVTADEFSTPFGVYRGGYVPAQADPRIVKDATMRQLAEQENQNMAYSFPTTSKGFTKARVEYNRPLMLDLRSLSQHIDKVLLFTHMEPAVRDVNRLITDKEFGTNLSRIDPAAIDGMLAPWLKRAATQQVETPVPGDGGMSRLLSVIRSRAGMSLMFLNVSNTLQQITGLPGAMNKVGGRRLAAAMATYLANPRAMQRSVAEASIFMKDRMENEVAAIQGQMEDILLDPSAYEKAQQWSMKHAYFLQAAFDNHIGPIVWTASYNQAVEQGMTDEDAVRFADGVIRQTQNTTLAEDVSRIETGPAYARLFTQFLGYFNMMANTNATELIKVAKEVGLVRGAGKTLGIVFFGILAPAWLAEAIAIAMRGGPDDEDDDGYLDDWMMQVAGLGTVKFALAGVPFAGQFAVAGMNRFNDSPVDDRVSLSPGISLLEGAVGAPYSVYQALVNDGNRQRAVRDVGTAISLMTGLPAHWLARPVGYWAAVDQGRVDPTSELDAIRGTLTGVASPDSR